MTKVTGELITIDDSAYDGFKGMTVYGKTVQNLWVNPSGTLYGVTATANASGSITVSGTSTFEGQTRINSDNVYTLKPNTSYAFYVDKVSESVRWFGLQAVDADGGNAADAVIVGGTSYKQKGVVFTTPSAFAHYQCALGIPTSGITASGTYRVMLREATPEEIAKAASTPQTLPVYPDGAPDASDDELGIMPLDVSALADSDFDDYWCPPGLSSIDEVEVVTAGKNILNVKPNAGRTDEGITYVNLGYGAFHVYGKATQRSYCPLDYDASVGYLCYVNFRGKTLTASRDTSNVGCYFGYFTGDVGGDYKSLINLTSSESASAVIPDEATWARSVLTVDSGVELDEIVHFSLEVGAVATGYEVSKTVSSPVPLSTHFLRSLPDGTRDELHIDAEGNCTLVKRVGKTVFNDMNYMFDSAVDGLKGFTGDFADDGSGIQAVSGDTYMCDKLQAGSVVGCPSAYLATLAYNVEYLNFISFADSIADINSWMDSNPVTLLYKLATPQTISLGKISLPKLRKKPLVNNVWANGTASGTGFALAPEIDFEYNPWSTYCDGFKTHGKHSYFDMGCCIAARDTGTPEKKSVTATVPYMSGFYDLSKLYGAVAFEARQLMYRFEFVEDSREELQQKKSQFLEWLSQVHDEEIADDDIPGRHFIGSLSEWEFEEGEEGQSGSLEVTFNCQPFMEADEDTTKTCNAGSNTVTVDGQAVNAYAKTNSGTATIRIGGVTQSVGTTEIRLSVQLQPGDNAVTVTGSPVVLRWKELTV